jgi:hypothetical protein
MRHSDIHGSAKCSHMSAFGVRRDKAVLFQWVKAPPGEVLPPEATGAAAEVTKSLKPSGISGPQNTVAARVCRP